MAQIVVPGRRKDFGEIRRSPFTPAEDLQNKAGCLLDEILEQYADFQVRTIDSFMTTIFKASALDSDTTRVRYFIGQCPYDGVRLSPLSAKGGGRDG